MASTSNATTAQGSTILELNNGQKIPALGFGAMKKGLIIKPEERDYVRNLITQALDAGYRTIDTSKIYATEDLVGEAIRRSKIPRSEITIITKLSSDDHTDVRGAFERSRALLGTYIDIYLMHWPQGFVEDKSRPLYPDESPTYIEVYKEMEKLVGEECRGIGVGNLTIKTLEPLLREVSVKPLVNEIEIQLLNPNLRLVPWCIERGIRPIAWGPLAGGSSSAYTDTSGIYDDPTLKSLAEKYSISAGTFSDPSAQNRQLALLEEDDMQQLNSFHETVGRELIIESAPVGWVEIPGKGRCFMGWSVPEIGWRDEEENCLT